jgi:hypothetical protein
MPAANAFPGYSNSPSGPAISLVAITPSDSTDLVTLIRDIRVGDVGGDVTVVTSDGVTITFKSTLPGERLGPFLVARVKVTGTAATNMVGYV